MFICPVCAFEVSIDKAICDKCGYNFNQKEISDISKLKGLLANLARMGKWPEEVGIKKQVNEIQIQKHGMASTTPNRGWSKRETAKLIGESHTLTTQDIRLAESLPKYPDLLHCKNKSLAKARLKKIQKSLSVSDQPCSFESEANLQICIIKHLDDIPIFKDWNIVNTGKYNTGEIGELDLLFRHKIEPKWLVVELKKELSSDESVGQILRYMGWVIVNLANENDKVEGMILSASSDIKLYYATKCTNIRIFHYILQNDCLSIYEDIDSRLLHLSKDEKKKLLELLNTSNKSDLEDDP